MVGQTEAQIGAIVFPGLQDQMQCQKLETNILTPALPWGINIREQAQCFLNGKPLMYSPEKNPFSFLKATLQKWLQILYMVPQVIQIALLERFLKRAVFTV